jgi:antitoxin component HigA of HigAB toxin-antitoxin module
MTKQQLHELIKQNYGTTYKMCKQYALSESTLSLILSGKKRLGLDMARKLSPVLNVTIDELLA